MKKILHILFLSVFQAFACGVVLLFSSTVFGKFNLSAEFAMYAFLGGYLFSKIRNKKIRMISVIITFAILFIIGGYYAFCSEVESIEISSYFTVCHPLSNALCDLFIDGLMMNFTHKLLWILLSAIYVPVTVIYSKFYLIESKKKEKLIFAVSIIIFIVLALIS